MQFFGVFVVLQLHFVFNKILLGCLHYVSCGHIHILKVMFGFGNEKSIPIFWDMMIFFSGVKN